MSLDKETREKFIIYCFSVDETRAVSIKAYLAHEGYDAFVFIDQELLLDSIKQQAPHVLVFQMDTVQGPLNEFVQNILNINQEILFLPIAPSEAISSLSPYKDFNFVGLISEGDDYEHRIFWQIDETCEKLFYIYQNEQLLDKSERLEKDVQNHQASSLKFKDEIDSINPFSVKEFVEDFSAGISKEELLDNFMKKINDKFLSKNKKIMGIYLKLLPSVQSLIVTNGINVNMSSLKGVGSKLSSDEIKNLSEASSYKKEAPYNIKALLEDGLKVKNFIYLPLLIHRGLDGLFLFWLHEENLKPEEFNNEFPLFNLIYQNAFLNHRIEMLDIIDPKTDLYNKAFYSKKLFEEVARSRRIQQPVSVVKLSMDRYVEMSHQLGVSNRDMIYRAMANLVKKTSRVNDYSARSDENEISLILPHTARKAAAIRSERLRRLIETHSFSISGLRVSVSLGISEFPSLCSSVEDLERTSSTALRFIQEKGGNKVCLYKPEEAFIPEFDIPSI